MLDRLDEKYKEDKGDKEEIEPHSFEESSKA